MSQQVTALRSPQIDANYLDEDFHSYNWEMFTRLFRNSYPHLMHTFKHEFQLFLRFLTSYNTILSQKNPATIGQQLLQIKYSTTPLTRYKKMLYLFSFVFSYIYEKFLVDYRRLIPFQIIYRTLSLMNFLLFLHSGKYVNLFERLIRLKTVHNHPPTLRILDYSYMKRELIWHTLNETLGTIIPFLTSLRARVFIRKYLTGIIFQELEQSNICSVCDKRILMPHESIGDCKHYFCYVCAYSLIGQSCPICFQMIHNIQPKESYGE